MFAVINPYRDADFFDFFSVLAQRFFQGITGQIRFQDLASDEVQILSLLCLCIASAPLGFFLVYRKMTMMANALCHTILLGMVVAFLITRPSVSMTISSGAILSPYTLMIASLITAIITTFLIQLLVQKARVQEDASIGIVFTTLFALGVVLVTLYTKNLHLASEAIMGNIDALDKDDLVLVGGVALFSSLSFIVFFRGFRLSTFDPLFSSAVGWPISFLSYMLMAFTAATSIAAFRAVGVLLVLTFFVAPSLMARLITFRLRPMLLLSFVLPGVISTIAIALSRHLLTVYNAPVSTSGLVVSLFGLCYLILVLFSPYRGAVTLYIKKKMALSKQ